MQIPNFVPRHCALIKDVLFDDTDIGVFYESCRLFAELLPELSDQPTSALDSCAPPPRSHVGSLPGSCVSFMHTSTCSFFTMRDPLLSC